MTTNLFPFLFRREMQRLIDEVRLYPSPDALWVRQGIIANSAGHLSQHLIGNLKTYIVQQLGGVPYLRNREAEFGRRYLEQEALLKTLAELSQQLESTLTALSDQQLQEAYTPAILQIHPQQTVSCVLTHLLTHLSYHTGQINYHRRLTQPTQPV